MATAQDFGVAAYREGGKTYLLEKGGYGQTAGRRQITDNQISGDIPIFDVGAQDQMTQTSGGTWVPKKLIDAGFDPNVFSTSAANITSAQLPGILQNYQNIYNDQQMVQQMSQAQAPINAAAEAAALNRPPSAQAQAVQQQNQQLAGMSQAQIEQQAAQKYPELAGQALYTPEGQLKAQPTAQSYTQPGAPGVTYGSAVGSGQRIDVNDPRVAQEMQYWAAQGKPVSDDIALSNVLRQGGMTTGEYVASPDSVGSTARLAAESRANAQAQSGQPITPPGSSSNYLDDLQKQLTGISPEETDLQNRLNDLLTAEALGINKIKDQPIAMPFITGQAASVERRAQAQADTLQRQLATAQAEREAKRQAAFDIASIEQQKEALASQKLRDQIAQQDAQRSYDLALQQLYRPMEVGGSLIDPRTGNVIYSSPTTGELDKLLTPTEAARLGVPYGTTRGQAAQGAITPAFGRTSSGGGSRSSGSSSTSTGQASTKQLDSMLKGYPQDFREYVKSIAPTVKYELTPKSIASLNQQFQTQGSPFAATKKFTSGTIPNSIRQDLVDDINGGYSLTEILGAYTDVDSSYINSIYNQLKN